MKKRVSRRFFLVPLLYAAVIFGLVTLQFSQVETSTDQLLNIELTSARNKGVSGDQASLRSLQVRFNGLALPFSPGNQLKIVTEDGIVHPAQLQKFTLENQELAIQFSHGLLLRIIPSSGMNQRVSIVPEVPETTPPIKELRIPYQWQPDTVLKEGDPGLPILPYAQEETQYYLKLSGDSHLKADTQEISLLREEESLPGIVVQQTAGLDKDAYEYWFAEERENMTREARDAAVKRFIDRAYSGWKTSRFDLLSGTWKTNTGTSEFKEATANAYLAEAYSRRYYTASINQVQAAALKNREKLTWRSSPYLGDIVNHTRTWQRREQKATASLEELLRAGRSRVFQRSDLFLFVQTRGLGNYRSRLEDIAANQDFIDEPLKQVVNRLQFYADAREYNMAPPETAEVCQNIIEARILPAIGRTPEGLFLKEEDNRVNLLLSLRAGILLEELGDILSLDLVKPVGWKMVQSAVRKADSEGFLPADLDLTNPSKPAETGVLLPETVYPLLRPDNPFYPHTAWLKDQTGENIWIWTIGEWTRISKSDSSLTMVVDFPEGKIHHMIIQNIPDFNRLYLHTIKWNTDPLFQRYSDGWLYDAEQDTLFLKIKHLTTDEAVRLQL